MYLFYRKQFNTYLGRLYEPVWWQDTHFDADMEEQIGKVEKDLGVIEDSLLPSNDRMLPLMLAESDLEEDQRELVQAAYDAVRQQKAEEIGEFAQIEHELLDEAKATHQFIKELDDDFSYDAGEQQLYFETDLQIEQYNQHVDQMDDLKNQEKNWILPNVERVEKLFAM